MACLDSSHEWLARARRVIPMVTQTLSKGPSQYVQGVSPIYLARGRGAHVWDVDGNEYVDYPMALGPVLLGHAEPEVDDAIRRQLGSGITFSLMHPLEVEVAERITAMCPGVEAVRFGKSGSDALSAAVRAARAYTGREHVVVAGYHGWHDWFIGSTERCRGVPKAVRSLVGRFAFNDLSDLARALDERRDLVAAVCLEPSGASVPADGFLEGVVELARSHGALCIFDEVITGFRLAPGGARERYGIIPDLSCYGKALGNGMPVSAVAGGWEVMRTFEDVFFSATHGGETLSLAAAATVLDVIADGTVLAALADRGRRLSEGIAARIRAHAVGNRVHLGGEPQMVVVGFVGSEALVTKSWVQQCLVEQGVLFNGSLFTCARHSDHDVDVALAAFDQAFAGVAANDDLRSALRGPPVQEVFRSS